MRLVQTLATQPEVLGRDLQRARPGRSRDPREAPVVEALAQPARHEAAQPQRIAGQQPIELAALVVVDRAVATDAWSPSISTVSKYGEHRAASWLESYST